MNQEIFTREIIKWNSISLEDFENFVRIWNEEYPLIIKRYSGTVASWKKVKMSEKTRHWLLIIARKKHCEKQEMIGFIQLQSKEKKRQKLLFRHGRHSKMAKKRYWESLAR